MDRTGNGVSVPVTHYESATNITGNINFAVATVFSDVLSIHRYIEPHEKETSEVSWAFACDGRTRPLETVGPSNIERTCRHIEIAEHHTEAKAVGRTCA